MKLSVTFLTILGAVASGAHRSQGYAGSTPVGLDGYVAFAHFDCARINADSRRSRERVPISADCEIHVPSPDGTTEAVGMPAGDDDEHISLVVGGRPVARGLNQPMVLRWNPDSSGFLLNDSGGSGRVSHLRYFNRSSHGWRESRRLGIAADRLYRQRFDCRAGRKSYTNTSGWAWTRSGMLRVIVQEGVHSEGCLQPHDDRNVLFEVTGDPVTGRIASSREIDTLP